MRSRAVLMTLIAPTLLAGCAMMNGGTVDDKRLAHLPAADRQTVLTAQHNVDLAQQNVATSRASKDEARQFKRVADNEFDAAQSRMKAAREGEKLGREAHSRATANASENQDRQAAGLTTAAQAKKDYAVRLIELRDAKLQQDEAAVAVAKCDLEVTKVDALKKNDMADGISSVKFADAKRHAVDVLNDRKLKTVQLEGEAESMKISWITARHQYDVANRDVHDPIITPPPAAQDLPATPSPQQP